MWQDIQITFGLHKKDPVCLFYRPIHITAVDKRALHFFVTRNKNCAWGLIGRQASMPIMMIKFHKSDASVHQCPINTDNRRSCPEARDPRTKISNMLPTPNSTHLPLDEASFRCFSQRPVTDYLIRDVPRTLSSQPHCPLPEIDLSVITDGHDWQEDETNSDQQRSTPVRQPPTPITGVSIFNSRVKCSIYQPTGRNYLMPSAALENKHMVFTAPGWIKDPRFLRILQNLKNGRMYASTRKEVSGNRDYYVAVNNTSKYNSLRCISVIDSTTGVLLVPVKGISIYPTIYNKLSNANVAGDWIQLSHDSNLFFLDVFISEGQHKMTLKHLADVLRTRLAEQRRSRE